MIDLYTRTLGFFAVTLVPVCYLHLRALPTVGELVDGVVSSLFFAAVFFVGLLILAQHAPRPGTRIDFGFGALTALVVWGLLWLLWSVLPGSLYGDAEASLWPSTVNVLLIFAAGLLSARFLERSKA